MQDEVQEEDEDQEQVQGQGQGQGQEEYSITPDRITAHDELR